MKKVITYGTFDLFHYDHINLLRRAKEQGDYLIVALSTDEFNWNEKQNQCYYCCISFIACLAKKVNYEE